MCNNALSFNLQNLRLELINGFKNRNEHPSEIKNISPEYGKQNDDVSFNCIIDRAI